MNDSLEALRGEVLDRIQQANSVKELEQLRIEVLGRSGSDYAAAARSQGSAGGRTAAHRRSSSINCAARSRSSLDVRLAAVNRHAKAQALEKNRSILRCRARRLERGSAHPLTLVIDEIIDIFLGMGFEIARGPDIEDDYHNFEALNIPKDHPARDMQDTFFVADGRLLRTHTSPVQIRTMETRKPPLQMIVPGAVYRHDDDATHSPMFHQVEGFMVDASIAFADLKGVLTHFLRQIFEPRCRRAIPSEFFSVHRAER